MKSVEFDREEDPLFPAPHGTVVGRTVPSAKEVRREGEAQEPKRGIVSSEGHVKKTTRAEE